MNFDPIREVQVIAPTNVHPVVGTITLNTHLQAALKSFRPSTFAHAVVQSSPFRFFKGDKVIYS
jgi:hypothetical protein